LEPSYGVNESETGPCRLLGVILVRLRVAEIHKHPIAHVLLYGPAVRCKPDVMIWR
jgi:hypothetical protein